MRFEVLPLGFPFRNHFVFLQKTQFSPSTSFIPSFIDFILFMPPFCCRMKWAAAASRTANLASQTISWMQLLQDFILPHPPSSSETPVLYSLFLEHTRVPWRHIRWRGSGRISSRCRIFRLFQADSQLFSLVPFSFSSNSIMTSANSKALALIGHSGRQVAGLIINPYKAFPAYHCLFVRPFHALCKL